MPEFFSNNEARKKRISESLKKHYDSDSGIFHKIAISQAKKEYWKKIKGD